MILEMDLWQEIRHKIQAYLDSLSLNSSTVRDISWRKHSKSLCKDLGDANMRVLDTTSPWNLSKRLVGTKFRPRYQGIHEILPFLSSSSVVFLNLPLHFYWLGPESIYV